MGDDSSEKPPDRISKPLMAAVASYACQFQLGAILGQSSNMLPQLQAADSPIQIDYDSATWIASMDVLGTPISCLLCGPLTDKMGRKATIRLFLLLSAVGHAIVGVASDVTEILIGRFCLGIAAGFAFPSIVYISEISSVEHRTPLLAINTISSSFGLLYVFIVGAFISWDIISLMTSLISVISLVYAFFIPESPAWLFQNHRLNDAIDSIKWLKGDDCDMTQELKQLKDACTEEPKGTGTIFRHFTGVTVVKPFFILLVFAFLQNGTGFYILLHYSINFISEFKIDFDPRYISIGLAVVRLSVCIMASYFLSRVNRKTAGMVSGTGMVVVLGGTLVAMYFMMGDATMSTGYSVIVTVGLLAFIFVCGLGAHPLPWIMIYELYPLHVRGTMCGVSNAINYVFIFIFIKMYYVLILNLQIHGTVILFAAFSAAFAAYSFLILPETQGKSLVEIEQGFLPKKQRQNGSA
nr:PREDICTED: facilitated trehalose transporter Tret1-like [Bemisia tabaci]